MSQKGDDKQTSDRELLELAAKAAGLEMLCWNTAIPALLLTGPTPWNPLENDGDALRLAVRLNIQITPRTDGKSEAAHTCLFIEDGRSDPYSATRRAIVRAAAGIGRRMA
jgi:hypothetical protein